MNVMHHVNNILQILLIFVLLRRTSTNADTTVWSIPQNNDKKTFLIKASDIWKISAKISTL